MRKQITEKMIAFCESLKTAEACNSAKATFKSMLSAEENDFISQSKMLQGDFRFWLGSAIERVEFENSDSEWHGSIFGGNFAAGMHG